MGGHIVAASLFARCRCIVAASLFTRWRCIIIRICGGRCTDEFRHIVVRRAFCINPRGSEIPNAGTRGAAIHTADFWWRRWRHIVIGIGGGLTDECRHRVVRIGFLTGSRYVCIPKRSNLIGQSWGAPSVLQSISVLGTQPKSGAGRGLVPPI